MAGYPMQALQEQMGQMSVLPTAKAGDSPLLSMFSEGNVIVLRSQASQRNVRIYDGEVQGSIDDGPCCQFIVHVRRPGVVALQNKNAPNNWLGFYEGRTVGTGGGGPFCEVMVGESNDKVVTLESVRFPGQKIGFFPDGRLKPAAEVTSGDDGCFVPTVASSPASSGQAPPQPMASMPPPPQAGPPASMAPGQYPPQGPPQASVAPGQYPPPTAPGQYPAAPGQYPAAPGQYPAAPGQYPPPQGYPQYPPGYFPPQGSATPPLQGSMMPPQQGYAPPPSVLPSGFSIMDAFRDGNVLGLISRSSGRPCAIFKGDVACCGRFSFPDSVWVVGAGPNNTISLTNSSWPGCQIAIRSSGQVLTAKGKKDKHAYFHVHVHPDNYVYFESAESPGRYVGFDINGHPCRPKDVAASEDAAKFFVRLERQKHPFSSQITTPYGWPSVFNMLGDRSVIQLYGKSTPQQFLFINKSGNVSVSTNGNDEHTFFTWIDRGMGIVTLQSRKSEGYRIRMVNFAVVGKGDCDFNADFRVKENSDRTITFESVTCPGGLLRMQVGKTTVDRFSVFLVTIQRFGRSETITKAPIN